LIFTASRFHRPSAHHAAERLTNHLDALITASGGPAGKPAGASQNSFSLASCGHAAPIDIKFDIAPGVFGIFRSRYVTLVDRSGAIGADAKAGFSRVTWYRCDNDGTQDCKRCADVQDIIGIHVYSPFGTEIDL
jgi:hypothetical protein